ncbi:hypothetical protein [Photorhabdus hindustanensis]|uniref:Uncharacterized protein n=1 Tax=Photorhabdus hindustanensis TaxID=2918802 RepID=A0A2S8QA37_9GAMM|nr:hypothetical protein [Photorhabdus hindustanensis]PQQ30039.1 hypothetical protein C6H66_00625 [Photorhabdus hindustanensis]
MNKNFNWDRASTQAYTKDYGNKTFTLLQNDSNPNSLNILGGANFIMNSECATLTLQNDSDDIPIYWPEFNRNNDGTMTDSGKGMQVTLYSGTLEANYTSKNRNHTVIYLGCSENAIFNLGNSGNLNIINPGTVFMFIDYVASNELKPPKLTMSGNSKFKITPNLNITPTQGTQQNNPAYIFLSSYIYLYESSELTLKSHGLFLGDGILDYCNINIRGNSKVTLVNDGIVPKDNIDRKNTKFNLGSGSPLLKLSSFTGTNFPLDLDNVEYPEGLFNFITTEGENKGKLVIDVSSSNANTFYINKLFKKKLIAIDNTVIEETQKFTITINEFKTTYNSDEQIVYNFITISIT